MKAGTPCPVCGSAVHPCPAPGPEEELTEATLKEMEREKRRADENMQKTFRLLAETEKEWKIRMEHLQEERKLTGKKDGAAILEKIEKEIRELEQKLEKKREKWTEPRTSEADIHEKIQKTACCSVFWIHDFFLQFCKHTSVGKHHGLPHVEMVLSFNQFCTAFQLEICV